MKTKIMFQSYVRQIGASGMIDEYKVKVTLSDTRSAVLPAITPIGKDGKALLLWEEKVEVEVPDHG